MKTSTSIFSALYAIIMLAACGVHWQNTVQNPQEKHFASLKQLTWGGDNAEAYWSFDNKSLTFQSNNPAWGLSCDQIFTAKIKDFSDTTFKPNLISTGAGRTTCSYYLKDNKHVVFASTHKSNKACPAVPDNSKAYVWSIYDTYDIYVSDLKGNILKQLTDTAGYDAEATVSPDGKSIVFTSTRSGDLELWTMDVNGKNLKQITFGLGYDGGAFFSPDNKKLVFRASRPKTEEEIKKYKDLLADGLVEPKNMEIYTCNVDGSDLKQITNLGKANWAPFFTPKGDKIIFCSNHKSTKGYDFQLYLIGADGNGIEQITFDSKFNSFPMFSPNGKYLVFSSNRNNHGTSNTNLFLAEWKD